MGSLEVVNKTKTNDGRPSYCLVHLRSTTLRIITIDCSISFEFNKATKLVQRVNLRATSTRDPNRMKKTRDPWSDKFTLQLKASPPVLTPAESVVVDEVRNELGSIPKSDWTPIDYNLFFPKAKVYKEGESVGIGRCVGTVHTSPERLLAWCYNFTSSHRMEKHVKANGPNKWLYPNKEVAKINEHHSIVYRCIKMPFPLAARDWLNRMLYTQIGQDKFVLVYKFIDETTGYDDVPPFAPSSLPRGNLLRGKLNCLYVFDRLPYGCCKFTYIPKADIRGSVPKVVAESGLSNLVDIVKRSYEFFKRDDEIDRKEREVSERSEQ